MYERFLAVIPSIGLIELYNDAISAGWENAEIRQAMHGLLTSVLDYQFGSNG